MSITSLALRAFEDKTFTPATEDLPFARRLEGSNIEYTHLAGPEVPAPGMVTGMRVISGGFDYTNIPGAESGFLVDGEALVTDADGSYTLKAGEGYYLPAGWSGRFEAVTPVSKVFYAL